MTQNYLTKVTEKVRFPLSQNDTILIADLYNQGLTVDETAEVLMDKLETV